MKPQGSICSCVSLHISLRTTCAFEFYFFILYFFSDPPPFNLRLVEFATSMLEWWDQFHEKAYFQSFPDLTKFLFPAKTLICRELWFHPKKIWFHRCRCRVLKVAKGFGHFPLSDWVVLLICCSLGQNYRKSHFVWKSAHRKAALRRHFRRPSKNTKNAITLSFFNRFGPNLAQR